MHNFTATGRPASAGRFLVRDDKAEGKAYIDAMWKLALLIPQFALLAPALWFAGVTWEHFAGEAIPPFGWAAIVGGVLFSLLVGGGLMALVFYSNRHGYDEGQGQRGPRP